MFVDLIKNLIVGVIQQNTIKTMHSRICFIGRHVIGQHVSRNSITGMVFRWILTKSYTNKMREII